MVYIGVLISEKGVCVCGIEGFHYNYTEMSSLRGSTVLHSDIPHQFL